MWWSPWFDRSTAHVAQHADSLGRSVASKAHGAGGSTTHRNSKHQQTEHSTCSYSVHIMRTYNTYTYNFTNIILDLLESNTCMTWHLWGVKIWRFWNLMMSMERFQDCFGISNIANFGSTALWFDLMLCKAFFTLRSALAARIVQRREAGYAPENGYL